MAEMVASAQGYLVKNPYDAGCAQSIVAFF
jgi:hypothetical protein